MIRVTGEREQARGSRSVRCSEEDALRAVRTAFPGAADLHTGLIFNQSRYYYRLTFSGDGFYGYAELDAEDGKLLRYGIFYGNDAVIPLDETVIVAEDAAGGQDAAGDEAASAEAGNEPAGNDPSQEIALLTEKGCQGRSDGDPPRAA